MKLLEVIENLAEEIPEHEELIPQFQEWLVSDERFEGGWGNKGARFYPSSFAYECDRSLALKFCKAPEVMTGRDPRLEITFELGNGIHDAIQRLFATFAKQRGWEFESEVRIKPESNPWFISARADGILTKPIEDVREGIEIKSINDTGFKLLWKRAKEEHAAQGNIYVQLLNLNCMRYLYVNKDKSTFKEFVAPLDTRAFRLSAIRLEKILLGLQRNKFPKCDNCTRRCAFHELNAKQPSLTPKDIPDEVVSNALASFTPVYVR